MKENSIEEDITLIEKSLCDKDTIIQYHCWVGTDFLNAVERIVADYKRVLKENEEWQRAYQEEKDKQFDLIIQNKVISTKEYIEAIIQQRDYYKARYNEFNEAFIKKN